MSGLEKQVTPQKGAMSIDEFCAWASIGRSKFYSEVAADRIKIRKIGRKSVVTMADADSWLQALPIATMREAA